MASKGSSDKASGWKKGSKGDKKNSAAKSRRKKYSGIKTDKNGFITPDSNFSWM